MAYDYQDDYARQAEEMRALQEEQERQRLEAERAAQQQAQQQAQPDRSLGGMLNPGQPPNTYQPGAYSQPAPNDPRALAGLLNGEAPAPNVTDYGQQRGTQGPMAAAAAGAPSEAPAAPPAAYQHDPNRDYSRNPLTGAELDAFGGNPYVKGATTYHGGTALPTGTATPGREGSSIDVDEFNKGMRGSELYQQFVSNRGLRDGKWTDADREAWRNTLRAQGVQVPDGMKIDDAGNLNQINKLGKRLIIGGAIVGGTLLTAGALGAFGGAAAAGGAGAGAAGSAGAGAALAGGAPWALTPLAGTAASVGTGASLAAGAGVAGAGLAAAAPAVVPAATTTAGAAGMGIMPSVITGLAGLGSTYMGARSQAQAGKQAAAATREASAASERTLTAQMEFEREQRAQDRLDAQKRWEAEQEMNRRMWEAQEDERLYERRTREEDRAAAAARGSGGGPSGPSGPDPRQLRKQQARNTLASLLAQGTPNLGGPAGYTPATSAGPLGRG
jgi:type II secretory pathway pseudopilin PulG